MAGELGTWQDPLLVIGSAIVERVAAFARQQVAAVERFTDGVSNDTYKVTFRAHHEPVVLRLYRDSARLHIEVAALRKVRGKVPVPTVLHVEPTTAGGMPAFIILEYVDGVPFREFRRRADRDVVREVACRIGGTMAAIHTASLDATQAETQEEWPFETDMAVSPLLRQRIGVELLRRIEAFVAAREAALRDLMTQLCFTHGDFNNRNVLVRFGINGWQVAAVVDWECAGFGTPLHDVARFLQYETRSNPSREPGFSRGYLAGGGHLPDHWWSLSRAINLVDQWKLLSQEDTPDEIVQEVIGLMRTTLAESASTAVP